LTLAARFGNGALVLKALQSRTTRLAASLASAGLNARQTAIVEALDRCMQEKGYAHTSLNDLAAAAGMSPSHLLYYFSGKEEVLEIYFRAAEVTILADVTAHAGDAAEDRIDHLAGFFFGGWLKNRHELGNVLELFGQAVRRRPLRVVKSRFDRRMKAYLVDLFGKTPRLICHSAEDAAESAFALCIGLIATTYFDERLNLARARSLYREGLRHLAGLPPARRGKRKRARRSP
jgi:AcrR family transcriptional regulator